MIQAPKLRAKYPWGHPSQDLHSPCKTTSEGAGDRDVRSRTLSSASHESSGDALPLPAIRVNHTHARGRQSFLAGGAKKGRFFRAHHDWGTSSSEGEIESEDDSSSGESDYSSGGEK